MTFSIQNKILYTAVSAFLIILGSIIAIQYAQGGYRQSVSPSSRSGLLAANSLPTGAEVKINNNLITATDDTVYLEPGTYQIEITKDGYTPWYKDVEIESELVTQTNARLFPKAPSLTALSFSGAQNIHPSPDGEKIVYYVASASASEKNGLYVLDLNSSTLSLQRESRQITNDSSSVDLAEANFIWSPDSAELLLLEGQTQVILNTNALNNLASLPSVVFRKKQMLAEWEEEMFIRESEFLSQFPEEVVQIATSSATNLYFSPDKKRLLYTVTDSASLAENLVPALPATSTQPEERSLEAGSIYVYDREEDKNFKVGVDDSPLQSGKILLSKVHLFGSIFSTDDSEDSQEYTSLQGETDAETTQNFNAYHSSLYSSKFQWFPDSKHLLYIEEDSVKIKEYDGTNTTTIYSGNFDNTFVYPWPNGDRVLINTTFSPLAPENLYAIELQ